MKDTHGYGEQIINVRQTADRQAPSLHISPIPEYILGLHILQDLDLTTTTAEFRLHTRVVEPIILSRAEWEPIQLWFPRE